MALQSHLVELQRKHKALEAELTDARIHLSSDDQRVIEIKRRKLAIKDEMARLRGGAVH